MRRKNIVFSQESLGFLLPLPDPTIPEWLYKKAMMLGLERKSEYHFTVIGSRTGEKIREKLTP